MKIVILMHSYYELNQGGAEYQAWLISKEFVKMNHEIHFVFLAEPGYEEKLTEQRPWRLHPIRKNRFKELSRMKIAYLSEVCDRLNEIQPDIIYHRNLSPFLYAAVKYARNNNAKTILHIALWDDVQPFKMFKKGWRPYRTIDNYFKFRAFKFVDAFITQTYEQQTALRNNHGVGSVLIRNLVPEVPSVVLKSKEDLVVWIANIKPTKNPMAFIELAREYKYTGYRFVMAGRSGGSKFNKIFQLQLKNSNVEYLGELSRSGVEELLCRAKILCCTSFTEGFSNTFLEAWARKVPVISLHVDPDNLLKKGGLGIKADNFGDLVNAVDVLMRDDSLREKIGEQARKYVLCWHSIGNAADQLEELVNSL